VARSTGMQVAVQHAGKHYSSALQPAADDTAGLPPLVARLLGQLAFPGRTRVGAQRPLVLRVRLLQRAEPHLRRAPLSVPLCVCQTASALGPAARDDALAKLVPEAAQQPAPQAARAGAAV